MDWHAPLELVGNAVRLRPLTLDDVDVLFEEGRDPSLWKWTIVSAMPDRDAMVRYVQSALEAQASGSDLAFVIEHLETGRCAGSTRYLEMRPAHKALEIGWTWVSPDFQRTRVNTECKYLLLRHAFETLEVNRVQLKTDALNEKSRAAIQRLGCQYEGMLRAHSLTDVGRIRDTVYYSMLKSEWPEAKARLERALES